MEKMAAPQLEAETVQDTRRAAMEEDEEDTELGCLAAEVYTEDDVTMLNDGTEGCLAAEDYTEDDVAMLNDDTEECSKKSFSCPAKHISIQRALSDLESLADLNKSRDMRCPLCPEHKFKASCVMKLQRHLQNIHWEISVELQGYRMCICYLPCKPMKPTVSGNQPPVTLRAHYHCIICAQTVCRRTEMVSHIKRHVTKGETSAEYAAAQMEGDTNVWVLPNHSTPQKSDTYFNPKMKGSRQLIFCVLATFLKERNPIACLDAFGGTGIMGLQWAKHFGRAVKVTINDLNENSVAMIQENCVLNEIKVMKQKNEQEAADVIKEGEEFINMVEVTNLDANVLMHLRAFDYIHLDPYGTAVNYLDAAFRNIRNLGIISVTSTDTATLYAKNLHVAQRNYGSSIISTEYYREAGVRILIAALARAAARSNKGIEVLLSVALEHFVLVVVRILRGPLLADECVAKIRHLIHCNWCEERIFQKEGNLLEKNPYKQLPCTCNASMNGKTAVEIGPMWSGSIFNSGFLKTMLRECERYAIGIQGLLKILICEADCTIEKSFHLQTCKDQGESSVVIRRPDIEKNCSLHSGESGGIIRKPDVRKNHSPPPQSGKRKHLDIVKESPKQKKCPAFYYSLHRHSLRRANMPKLNKFLQYLTDIGFQVSRTHFEPTGVRTNATLKQIKSILKEYSNFCSNSYHTGLTVEQAGDCSHFTEDTMIEFQQPSKEKETEQNVADVNCPQNPGV